MNTPVMTWNGLMSATDLGLRIVGFFASEADAAEVAPHHDGSRIVLIPDAPRDQYAVCRNWQRQFMA